MHQRLIRFLLTAQILAFGSAAYAQPYMIQEAIGQVHNGAIGRPVAHYSTYYTNPVKPLPPENTRPATMSDIEWQIRNWYNFNWLSGDSLVEQAVHNADKIMVARGVDATSFGIFKFSVG